MTEQPQEPRYTAKQLGDPDNQYNWGPYDTTRQRWIMSTRMTKADAQERANRLNVSGIDWTYSDDPPRSS